MPVVLPVETIDDDNDDGFDWEAAVREIDVACTLPSSSTSHPPHVSSLRDTFRTATSVNHTTNKPPTSRQSTLDQFVAKPCPMPSLEANRDVKNSNFDGADQSTACCLDIDPDAAKTWIYPVNIPLRDYQFSITKTALFSNTLVALPTGLGKTLIAAVVMYNFFRWFPEGKIVFTAPSRPLVMQQIEACHNIVGMPLEWTIDMTGQTSPRRRACLWKSKRVFFVTPQVLEKDIQSGTCMIKNLVCLVIDEAHRAMGNYSYSVAVRQLMATPLQLRILALSATPGSNQQTIQQVIDNLHISTLEYRNESDHDVSPYVHNRKLELIVVPMGQDAVEINNLLSEVIHPFVTRLSALGVLQYLNFQNLSPCELLNSREKFRQAWPPDLPHFKSREIEGYFGVLITLYHMRKLLSSHGIRPAYEMLEEKSKGPFARHTSRNEVLHKVKLLMQKSLSHGAPSPKLSKLTDVLVDHFKTNSPESSRVIIFANFRGSVRDIINAIESIGEYVKATEFIGQSSGKVLRGQTQKVQQAVLEKFRAGGYNVIVATSIGEEGLDIMEVDLVICFDANISSLRMIQRMGRTGRKNDGRVVILSCEGSELKGYMRKKAKNKTLGKHMQNGGVNSFRFHSSPRMIPHVFKPEVQLVELSIEQFIRHGRKVTDEHLNQTHIFSEKLTDGEIEAVAKYFHPNGENKLRLSLIAFPHFQSFPSGVHRVMHSFRTGILINSMQHLQEITVSKDSKTLVAEDGAPTNQCSEIENVERLTSERLKSLSEGSYGSLINENTTKQNLQTTDEQNMHSQNCQNVPAHLYLFGSNFVSVDVLGKVQIISVPFLALEENSKFKSASKSMSLLFNHKQVYSDSEVLTGDFKPLNLKAKDAAEFSMDSHAICTKSKNTLSSLCNSDGQQRTLLDKVVRNPNSSHSKIHTSNQAKIPEPTKNYLENKSQIQLVEAIGDDFRDPQLSPRLNSFIERGVVPESPLDSGNSSDGAVKDAFLGLDVVSHAKLLHERENTSGPIKIELAVVDRICCGNGDSESPNKVYVHSPVAPTDSLTREVSGSPFLTCKNLQSPLDNLTNNSCCKDWLLSSDGKSDSVERRSRFKRLRKFEESCSKSTKRIKLNALKPTGLSRSCDNSRFIPKMQCQGKRKEVDTVRAYLEDEAEVSSEAFESDDEEDEDGDSFDESFIDDRLDSTAASTQAEAGGIDMMAIYRRSLLSQSPIENFQNCSMIITPVSVAGGSACPSGKNVCSLLARQSAESTPHKTAISQKENDFRMENRNGKWTFPQTGNLPIISLDKKFVDNMDEESSMQYQAVTTERNGALFYDDDLFYESIDLDAVEAQATNFLKSKNDLSLQKQEKPLKSKSKNDLSIQKREKPLKPTQSVGFIGSPSFDLGI